MGYKRAQKVYKLKFADPEFEGLEVRAKSIPTKLLMELSGIKFNKSAPGDEINHMFGIFADALVEWNLEDEDGNPVPATFDGVMSQDIDFVLDIIMAWMDAVAGVSEDLKEKLNSGEISLAESIPMEISVPDLAS